MLVYKVSYRIFFLGQLPVCMTFDLLLAAAEVPFQHMGVSNCDRVSVNM